MKRNQKNPIVEGSVARDTGNWKVDSHVNNQ